jgi:hypothetical protein
VPRSTGYGSLHEGRRARIVRSASTCVQLFNTVDYHVNVCFHNAVDYQVKFRFHVQPPDTVGHTRLPPNICAWRFAA